MTESIETSTDKEMPNPKLVPDSSPPDIPKPSEYAQEHPTPPPIHHQQPPPSHAPSTSTMTPEELAIFQRVKSQSREWETISEEEVDDYSLREDPFKLPDPVQELEKRKEFKFRWIERRPERLDEVRSAPVPHRWWIVNESSFPYLAPYNLFDPVLGCITRHDQMLVFKPYWMFEKRQDLINQITETQDRGALEFRGKENRDGVLMEAGKKSMGDYRSLSGEIRAGDEIVYEDNLDQDKISAEDLSDLMD